MLFCCGDQLNVASLSGLTQQWEAQRAPPAPPAQKRGRRAAVSSASRSRKCGLVALSLRDKWLQRTHRSNLVNINRDVNVCDLVSVVLLGLSERERERGRGVTRGVKFRADPTRYLHKRECVTE